VYVANQEMLMLVIIDGSGDGASAAAALTERCDALIAALDLLGDNLDNPRPTQTMSRLVEPWYWRHAGIIDAARGALWVKQVRGTDLLIKDKNPLLDMVRHHCLFR
jgi:hypothetical protein